MCGIIGYFGKEAIKVHDLFDALAELEAAQSEKEKTPVGGHGAGILFFDGKREVIKLGKDNGSPAQALRKETTQKETRLVLAHVRRASKQFLDSIQYGECAQPYCASCIEGLEVVSAHNGFLRTYRNIKRIIGNVHHYESEKKRLIDSEVIPHYFEKLYVERKNFNDAARALHLSFCGKGNAVALVLRSETDLQLALLYKGKARGLYVWENHAGDVFFSTRRAVIESRFSALLQMNKFKLVKVFAQGVEGDLIKVYAMRHLTLPSK